MSDNILLAVNEYNQCRWRLTPWDKKVFQLNTAEILNIEHNEELPELFNLIEEQNAREKIDLCFFRHNANDRLLKKEAFLNNYRITEFSVYAYHPDISKLPPVRLNLEFAKPTAEDIPEIKRIAAESFKHGRFHEDPFIEQSLARLRYERWIDTLVKDTEFYVLKLKDKVGGFFNYVVSDGWIEMPLSGLSQEALKLGGFLWVKMHLFAYEKEGVKKVKNLISGANIDVLNLHAKLGFNFGDPMFGYHKYYQKEDKHGRKAEKSFCGNIKNSRGNG